MSSAAEVLDGHISLDIECLDRIYLNGYVPSLQVGGQVVTFMRSQLGQKIPSPAIFRKLGDRFRKGVREFAEDEGIPVIQAKKGERKLDLVRPMLRSAEREGRFGVVAILRAQEYQNVFAAYRRELPPGHLPFFNFVKADRRVTCFYFYVFDREFGPGFVKICSYFPYPIKVWCNGHEWAKRQACKAGLEFQPLSNGFASCEDSEALQKICSRLDAKEIQRFFERWMAVLPAPLTTEEQKAGYGWELSMRQIEVARTLVFSAPRHARSFVESLVRDNMGIGRPHEVELIFAGRPVRRGRPRTTNPETFKTKIVTRGVDVTVNIFYKRSRMKQYLKEGRALRIEFVVNSPDDLRVQRRLKNLPELLEKALEANRRILHYQHAGQDCAIGPTLFERIQQPYVREGQRTGALRFGDLRVMALAGALCHLLNAMTGFTNRSLRARVAALLGQDFTARQMTYDLRRLRLHGLIEKVQGHTYQLTQDGLRFAIFYCKLADRVITPLFDPDRPNAPQDLRKALRSIETSIGDSFDRARLPSAA